MKSSKEGADSILQPLSNLILFILQEGNWHLSAGRFDFDSLVSLSWLNRKGTGCSLMCNNQLLFYPWLMSVVPSTQVYVSLCRMPLYPLWPDCPSNMQFKPSDKDEDWKLEDHHYTVWRTFFLFCMKLNVPQPWFWFFNWKGNRKKKKEEEEWHNRSHQIGLTWSNCGHDWYWIMTRSKRQLIIRPIFPKSKLRSKSRDASRQFWPLFFFASFFLLPPSGTAGGSGSTFQLALVAED